VSQLLEIPGAPLPYWGEDLRTDPGFLLDELDNDEYHAAAGVLSRSAVQLAMRSMLQLRHAIDTQARIERGEAPPKTDEEREALVTGSAFHCFTLEPMAYGQRYVELPDLGDMRSAKKRAFRDDWLREHALGRQALKPRQVAQVRAMRESALRIPKIRALLENGQPEVTALARDPGTGLPRKARTDWLAERLHTLMDLKSARDASRDAWKREAGRRGYYIQDPWYRDVFRLAGCEIDEFLFVVVEKTPPYDVGLYTLGASSLYAGEQKYMHALRRIFEAVQSGRWPGYTDDKVEVLDVPNSYVKEAEALEQNP